MYNLSTSRFTSLWLCYVSLYFYYRFFSVFLVSILTATALLADYIGLFELSIKILFIRLNTLMNYSTLLKPTANFAKCFFKADPTR